MVCLCVCVHSITVKQVRRLLGHLSRGLFMWLRSGVQTGHETSWDECVLESSVHTLDRCFICPSSMSEAFWTSVCRQVRDGKDSTCTGTGCRQTNKRWIPGVSCGLRGVAVRVQRWSCDTCESVLTVGKIYYLLIHTLTKTCPRGHRAHCWLMSCSVQSSWIIFLKKNISLVALFCDFTPSSNR